MFAILKIGSDQLKQTAVLTLRALAVNNSDNTSKISAEIGNIQLLVNLLKSETSSYTFKSKAAGLLEILAFKNPGNQTNIAEAGAIPILVKLLEEGTDEVKIMGATTLGKLAFNHTDNQSTIVSSAGIPSLVGLLKQGTFTAKKEAAVVLGCLASINSENQRTKIAEVKQLHYCLNYC